MLIPISVHTSPPHLPALPCAFCGASQQELICSLSPAPSAHNKSPFCKYLFGFGQFTNQKLAGRRLWVEGPPSLDHPPNPRCIANSFPRLTPGSRSIPGFASVMVYQGQRGRGSHEPLHEHSLPLYPSGADRPQNEHSKPICCPSTPPDNRHSSGSHSHR